MKILLLTQEYPPFAGGAGLYASHLADELAELGEKVMVIAPAYKEDSTDWDRRRKYKLIRTRRRFKSKFSFIIQCYQMAVNLIKEKPAIVHSTEAGAHKVLAVVSLFLPFTYKLFITIHGTEVFSYLAPGGKSITSNLVKSIISRLFDRANKIICVSNSTKELLNRHYHGSKTVVIYPGINLNNFYPPSVEETADLKSRLKLKVNGPVLLSVARLVEVKGHDVVIKALSKVATYYPAIRYIIVGDGSYRGYLYELTSELGLTEHVIFTGKVDINELPLYYNIADLFIMPSRRGKGEGLGVVFVEAYYYKKPVIGSTHGGVPEVVKHNLTGYTVDPYSVNEVEDAILSLISDPVKARQMGEAGHRLALEKFNTGVMACETLQLYC